MTTNPLDQTGTTELCTTSPTAPPASTRGDRAPGMHWSWRTDRRISWVGHHTPELAGVLVPVAAVAFWDGSWVFLLVTAATAALWGRHEWRTRQDKSRGARRAALTPDQPPGTQTATAPSDQEGATRGHLA